MSRFSHVRLSVRPLRYWSEMHTSFSLQDPAHLSELPISDQYKPFHLTRYIYQIPHSTHIYRKWIELFSIITINILSIVSRVLQCKTKFLFTYGNRFYSVPLMDTLYDVLNCTVSPMGVKKHRTSHWWAAGYKRSHRFGVAFWHTLPFVLVCALAQKIADRLHLSYVAF